MSWSGQKRLWVLGCCLCSAIIGAELLSAHHLHGSSKTALETPGHPGKVGTSAPPPKDLTQLLARPVFSKGRKPPQEAVAAPPDAGPPRLAAIIIGDEGKSALFELPGAAKMVTLTEGETIADWKVRRIEAEHVLLQAAAGFVWLEPDSGADAGKTAPLATPGVEPKKDVAEVSPKRPSEPIVAAKNALNDHF